MLLNNCRHLGNVFLYTDSSIFQISLNKQEIESKISFVSSHVEARGCSPSD